MSTAPPELLDNVPLFEGLTRQERQAITSSMKGRSLDPGETIAVEGEEGVGFFVIESGTARVTIGGEERRTLGPGDYFGEIALIDGGARSATVTASSELVCWGLTYWDFRPLVQENAKICWKLLQAMAKRLRELFAEQPRLANAASPRAGITPLFCLPDDENAAVAITRLLLAHGADPNFVNKKGLTAQQDARRRGLIDAADLMSGDGRT